MKIKLLLLLVMPFLGFSQLMPTGNYVIANANTADSYPNFRYLTTAITYLNSHGIDGDVKFLLDNDQTTTSPIIIMAFTNTNNKTVTIKPNTGKNIVINGNMLNSTTGIPSVFLFNGSSNVVIDGSNSAVKTKNLTIVNNDNLNINRAVVWIASNGTVPSSKITVKNSVLKFANRNGDSFLQAAVYSGKNSNSVEASTSANSEINIADNEAVNVKEGININGNATASLSPFGWKIQGNNIGSSNEAEKPVRGIYVSNALNYEISGNTISGVKNTINISNDAAAIIALGTSSGAIFNNNINNIVNTIYNNGFYTAGVLIRSSGATSIYNNIISNVYNTTADANNYNYENKAQGIFVTSGSAINIYYNTVIMNGAPNGTAYSSCLYLTGGSNINIKNNIFVNSQSNQQYGIFRAGGTIAGISNNDYYVTNATNTFSNRNNGTEYTGNGGFTGWNAAVSDSGSKSILPAFVSATDFHLQLNAANAGLSGVSIANFTTDIDGQNRVKPYMGADEVEACSKTETAGNNYWKGYVYSYSGTPAATMYVGSVAENAIFDRNVEEGTITGNIAVEPNDFCSTIPNDNFFVKYLMNVTLAEAGAYIINVGGDDGYRLYIDDLLVPEINNWTEHSYTTSFVKKTLTAGSHVFRLEYFEKATSSRVSFSYGLPKGDPTLPYGDNVWNVYGFTKANLDFTNTELRDSYAGYYVDPAMNFNSQNFWNKTQSPSIGNSAWNGAPIQIDNFTLTYKRKGFPCGRYQIQLVNCDDVAQVYIDGTMVFSQTYTINGGLINNGAFYTLNKNSQVEIRLREDGGDANVAFRFIEVPFVYDGSTPPPAGSSITVNQDSNVSNNLEVCSCYISAGRTLTVPANVTLTVLESIDVKANGKLVVKNDGSLLQDVNGIYIGAADSFIMERTSSPMKNFDYSYWSSPVTAQKLYDVSPNTLLDKFMSFTGTAWKVETPMTKNMDPGIGYIIRVPKPDFWPIPTATSYSQPVQFKGIPNNGNIAGQTVVAGNFYLIGNPYPSAMKASDFLAGNAILSGTVYFWTHNTAIKQTGSKYIYVSDDYATLNGTGGVAATSGGAPPSGYIAAGQSFFGSAIAPGTIQFSNGMRVAGNNNQFFKPAKTAKTSETSERNRLWLNMTNAEGAFKQTLIGYVTGATNDLDNDFDGETFDGNSFIDFYSVNNTDKLVIQGRALPFEDTDVVPLGYSSTIAGDFTIAIDNADGLLASHKVYLEDKQTNTVHDLTTNDYTFTTEKGTFDERFVVKYTNKTLGTGDFETSNNGVEVAIKNKVITLNSEKDTIDKVFIYDITGKELYNKDKIATGSYSIDNLKSTQQILLVKVILENGYSTTKKLIFR